jgi:hypothetical protein
MPATSAMSRANQPATQFFEMLEKPDQPARFRVMVPSGMS